MERNGPMNNHKSVLLTFCAFLCISVAFAGCRQETKTEDEKNGTAEYLIPTAVPENEYVPTDSEGMTQEEADLAFMSVDRELFVYLLTKDRKTAALLLNEPERYGVDLETASTWWGDYSEEQYIGDMEIENGFLERLREIPRERLSERYVFAYDTIETYLSLNASLKGSYFYMEPLSAMEGCHTGVLTTLGAFQIHSRDDVERYLQLLSDVPRFFEQIMAFEMEKADRGLFMPKSALSIVLSQIDDVTDVSKPCFLIPLFNNKLASVSDISPAERERYIDLHTEEISTGFIPAYQMLHDGLSVLSSKCRYDEGLASLGKNGTSFFETRMKLLGCSDEPAADLFAALEREAYYCLIASSTIGMLDSEETGKTVIPTLGSVNEDLKYLMTLTENRFSVLPEHSLAILTVPSSLRNYANKAELVKPAIDSGDQPVLLLNDSSGMADMRILAHEAYPGYLTQRLLQRNSDTVSLSQRALTMDGYEAGWAAEAEQSFIRLQAQFLETPMLQQFYDDMVRKTILPALVSIRVNYYGDGPDKIRSYLADFGYEEETEVYYQYAVTAPEYYLPSAIGYTMLSGMARRAEQDLEQHFSLPDFLMEYLSYGPGYSSALSDRMDLWVDSRFSAGA